MENIGLLNKLGISKYLKKVKEYVDENIQYIETTYDNLVNLRNNSQLIPSQQYRITDYVTTTTQANTQSAGHQFDIIVTAVDEGTLNENALALIHEGDTYFTENGANLDAWEIKYTLDNDANKFEWADSANGKGVIYYMKDEWSNECPYDFKNIMFKHPNDMITYPDYYYTFSTIIDSVVSDHSMLEDYCYGNTMKEYIISERQYLNRNVFLNTSKTTSCHSNSFGDNCYENSFGRNCYNNTFGNSCSRNEFGSVCYSNTFGDGCGSNEFGNSCMNNSFGNNCSSNSFRTTCYSNSFGINCVGNSFGDYYEGNSFGNNCWYNSFRVSANISFTLKNYVRYNHFDDGCSYNVIWNSGTTSSSVLLKNININRGVCGTRNSFNYINIATTNSEQEINVNQVDGIISIGDILSIRYESLKTLRDNSQLISGQQYRITDYVTTTIQEGTQSANHPFDIIVTADDASTLNENARVAIHDGDTYFAESDLNAWQIWYCLDNDTDRFAWADATNGKGVIYRMIDERNNDCSYDFKNIKFKCTQDEENYPDYYYTFTLIGDGSDYSLNRNVRYNTITPSSYETNKLPENIILTSGSIIINVELLISTKINIIAGGVMLCQVENSTKVLIKSSLDIRSESDLTVNVANIKMEGDCNRNKVICYTVNMLVFGAKCVDNYIQAGQHIRATIGSQSENNKIISERNIYLETDSLCSDNVIETPTIQFVKLGDNASNNVIKGTFGQCFIGNNFQNNTITNQFSDNIIGEKFRNNTIGIKMTGMTIGHNVTYNSIREEGNIDSPVLSGDSYSFTNSELKTGTSYNIFTLPAGKAQNLSVSTKGTASNYIHIPIEVADNNYQITVAQNSQGVIKQYCEADLIA